MQADAKHFRTFEDLEAYRAARGFRKAMYAVSRRFPDIEKFGLASQVRRAAVSLTNNIAEGHGRYHYLDQIKFTLIARGSLQELIDDLNICEDEQYLTAPEVARLKQEGWRVYQLFNGYIRYLRERKTGSALMLHESAPGYDLSEEEIDAALAEPPPDLTIQRFNGSTV
jgi:four helix bundle protein